MSKVDDQLYHAKYGKDDVEYFKHLPEVESVETMHDEIIIKFKPNPKRISVYKPYGRCTAADQDSQKVVRLPYNPRKHN